jgi:hypothetical protein
MLAGYTEIPRLGVTINDVRAPVSMTMPMHEAQLTP